MPSVSRTLFTLAPAAAIAAILTLPLAAQSALGSPIQELAGLNHALSPLPREYVEDPPRTVVRHVHSSQNATKSRHPRSAHPKGDIRKIDSQQPRAYNSASSNMARVKQYYGQAAAHAQEYGQLAAQSKSVQPDDQAFQQQASTQLTGFHTNLLGLQTALDQLGADRGLANEDRENDVETLLKNLVNTNKDVLSSTYTLVSNVPVLGPVLGPVVYDIKCVLEKVLDGIENLGDSVINAIQPLLKGLLDSVLGTSPTCQSGVNLLDICI